MKNEELWKIITKTQNTRSTCGAKQKRQSKTRKNCLYLLYSNVVS